MKKTGPILRRFVGCMKSKVLITDIDARRLGKESFEEITFYVVFDADTIEQLLKNFDLQKYDMKENFFTPSLTDIF